MTIKLLLWTVWIIRASTECDYMLVFYWMKNFTWGKPGSVCMHTISHRIVMHNILRIPCSVDHVVPLHLSWWRHTIRSRQQAKSLRSYFVVLIERPSRSKNTTQSCHGLHFLMEIAGRSLYPGFLTCLVRTYSNTNFIAITQTACRCYCICL